MTNFSFLQNKTEYALFANACIDAEKIYFTSLPMCATACRKALELSVKWVYAIDNTMKMPYRNNIQSLIHEPSFRFAVNVDTWKKIPFIIKLGNDGVHTINNISKAEVLFSMRSLFEFIQWIDYCYGKDYQERKFDESLIPNEKVDIEKFKAQQSLIEQQQNKIEELLEKIKEMSEKLTAQKENNKNTRTFTAEDLSEFETRKMYINLDLKRMGWHLEGTNKDVETEEEFNDIGGVLGKKGLADYVLYGKDRKPLAVIEAKRTSKDPKIGKTQAVLYADSLERKSGVRPIIFLTNGFETYFWDDKTGPERQVSSVFCKDDLQKIINRRKDIKPLKDIAISDKITDRYYQKEAIRAVCDNIEEGFRKSLLVMATGTGKTRTAASLVDVLSRGGYVTNVLFLADRTALVKQAKDGFKEYLPDMTLCNLCENKEDRRARIVFSTYPTILNAISNEKNEDDSILFTPAHFDLIIIDESHRSIFKKYRAIFEYFDALLVGLTATPKDDVHRNTYEFFDLENNVPTYAYDYETAVDKDHVLVDYYNYEVKTLFSDEGITYDKLSEKDKERYEDDFTEDDGSMPEFIPSQKFNDVIFNRPTIDMVLQDLMEKGIKVAGGDRLGKTIIFAQNKNHANIILERFNALYKKYKGQFAQVITCEDSHAINIIEDFEVTDKMPQIAISVDMMDTGIDVPECVNLVFFKKVRSKTKFWQMIGRGTRLAPDLACVDCIDGEYVGKRRFLIFDYCGNFEFFRQQPKGFEVKEAKTLKESIFEKRINIISALQNASFADEEYQSLRKELVDICHGQVKALSEEITSVRLKRRYVEKFKKDNALDCLSETDKLELTKEIAPIVDTDDDDEAAKRFDNFMYGMMLAALESKASIKTAKKQLYDVSQRLQNKATIPQVKEKLDVIKEVQEESFLNSNDILLFEKVRKELRGVMQFLVDEGKRNLIVTSLTDPIVETKEGQKLEQAYDFEDYRKKVNRYVEEHSDTMAIYKINHNLPLSQGDYQELERILTCELGSKEDYNREYGDTPFGLLIRRIAKLDHDAAMKAFSAFMDDESLNSKQNAFLKKIINYVEQNGYMESVTELQKPPFDKPVSFTKLFDLKTREAILETIKTIKENAENFTA